MFAKWYWQTAKNNFSKNETHIIMALAQNLEADENGRLYAWRSCEELARLTGMTTGSVSSAIHRLTKPNPAKGRNIRGLELKSAGHRGRASEYYVMPDTPIEAKPSNDKTTIVRFSCSNFDNTVSSQRDQRESTASIELPKDAEGREIPLDTKVLYMSDGTPVDVDEFNFSTGYSVPEHKWTAKLTNCAVFFTTRMFLNPPEPPDSWEKLEEDLGRGADALNYEACAYFGKSSCDCSSCIADKGETCEIVVMRDIADRIRKLRGEN